MTIEHQTPQQSDGWYSEANATFGDRLAGAREALGISQRELADRLGVRLRTVQHWEEDVKEPRANRLQMLAGMLNVSLMWLLTGEGPGVAAPDDLPPRDRETEALMKELRDMRSAMGTLVEQIGRIEARLRLTMAREAA